MDKVLSNFVGKEELEKREAELNETKQSLSDARVDLARTGAERDKLLEQIKDIESGLEEREKMMRLEFESLSNRILEDKGKRMLENNEAKLNELLNPLKERIKEFEEKVDTAHKDDIKDRATLNKALEQMMELNAQMSDDAVRLTKALKGDSKFQGDWGEMQLERILLAAGLEEDIHFVKQASIRNEKGELQKPDYIINLPDNKQLVLDAKVSLTAYEAYVSEQDNASKESAIKAHKKSLADHINGLSSKNYQSLYSINQPDYVIMFVPIEPALTLGFKHYPKLFEKAMDKNIVLVSTSTLLATLRTIAYIWKQENQKQNARQIAWESGKLYDKFVGFMEDLSEIGKKLDGAQEAYEGAFNKLTKSTKKGDTIVGRIENLKKLGAEPSKQIPDRLIN
jgi:DNA recombination protein RmuC